MTLPHQDPTRQKKCSLSSRGAVTDKVTEGFRSWLISKNYSPSTIRNYLSDINAYFESNKTADIFSPDTVSLYLQTIQKNSAYSRYLSSLSKFFQFTQDQSLISTDPLKAALKHKKPSTDEIINQYSQYLNKKRFSESTIKNYLNDIRQFNDWCLNQNPTTFQTPSLKNGGLKQIFKNIKFPLFQGGMSRRDKGVSSES